MATYTTTGGAEFGNIPLDTLMVDKDAVVEIVSGSASGVVDTVSGMIATAISTAWKAGGSKSAADLIEPGVEPETRALLIKENEGKVYNMSTSGTTDSFFVEGAGKPYTAGTDIAVINTGTDSSPVYKFNVLATQDSSVVKQVNGYTPTNGAVTIPNAVASGQTGAKDGLMSSGDKYKLNNIAAGAEVNQNAFSKIAVDGVTGTGDAGSKTATLTLVPGTNVTMSRSGTFVTINSSQPDVSGVVHISGAETITGTKTFSGESGNTHVASVTIAYDGGNISDTGVKVAKYNDSDTHTDVVPDGLRIHKKSGTTDKVTHVSVPYKAGSYGTALDYGRIGDGDNIGYEKQGESVPYVKVGDTNISGFLSGSTKTLVPLEISGANWIAVSASGKKITIDGDALASGIADAISGLDELDLLSGVKVGDTVFDVSGKTGVLEFVEGSNVSLSGSNDGSGNITVQISAIGSVTGAKISGTSSLSDGSDLTVTSGVIILPKAATGGYGAAKLTNTIDNSSGLAITPYAVNSGLATKVAGSDLHSALTSGGLSPQSSYSGNTIYALVAALHAVDGVQET